MTQGDVRTAVTVHLFTFAHYSYGLIVFPARIYMAPCVLMHLMSIHGTVDYLSACLLKQTGVISSFNDSCTYDVLTRLLE